MRQGRSALLAACFFVLGLSTVFLLLGFAASIFGAFFLSNSDAFAPVAGLIVMLFGAHFLGILRLPFLERDLRIEAPDSGGSAMGAYLLGLAFAFGWTPCIGPLLGAHPLASPPSRARRPRAPSCSPSMPPASASPSCSSPPSSPASRLMSFFKRHMERIERLMGLLLWTIGLLMLTGGFSQFSYWLLEHVPFLANLG